MKVKRWHRFSLFQVLDRGLFLLFALVCLYPFWHTVVGSLIPYSEYMQKTLLLWPEHFTTEAYQYIFSQGYIWGPLYTTVFITFVGTLVQLVVVTTCAYALSKSFPGRKFVIGMIIVTMFVNGGLMPSYILYQKLHLLNTLWVYILPCLFNTYHMILLRTHFLTFPHELEESAYIDGAGDLYTFTRIVLPLSKPMLVTITLFTAVAFWNTFAQSLYFVSDPNIKTLQDYLYSILADTMTKASGTGFTISINTSSVVFSENIKLANTVIAIVPILLVYPFLQKHMARGIMIGALKG